MNSKEINDRFRREHGMSFPQYLEEFTKLTATEDRYCELCQAPLGRMSIAQWLLSDRICPQCEATFGPLLKKLTS